MEQNNNNQKPIIPEENEFSNRATVIVEATKENGDRQTIIMEENDTNLRSTIIMEDVNAPDERQTIFTSSDKDDDNRVTLVDQGDFNQNNEENRSTIGLDLEHSYERNTNENSKVKRQKLDVGDIVNGYTIGEILNDTSGEADIHFCYKNDKTYVIKIYKQSRKINREIIEKIIKVNSPYLLTPLEIGEHNGRFYEIQTFYEHGTILQNAKSFDNDFIKKVIIPELTEAINTFHELGSVHNDIKPQNIFLTNDRNHIVIGDFGISQSLQGREMVTRFGNAMTTLYAAPEADEIGSVPTDYYALGMTLLHVSFKEDPFYGISDSQVRKLKLMYTTIIPEEVDPDIGDLIYGLVKKDPQERFGFKDIQAWLKNPLIFRGIRDKQKFIDESIRINYTFAVDGKRELFTDFYNLGLAMLQNIKDAEAHFSQDIISNTLKLNDQEASILARDLYVKYYAQKTTDLDPLIGLYLTFYKLEKNLPIIFDEKIFENFGSLIVYLIDEYPKVHPLFINDDFLNDVIMPRLKDEAQDVLRRIMEEKTGAPRLDLILSYFAPFEVLTIEGEHYDKLGDFASSLFKGVTEQRFSAEGAIFYEILEKNFKLPADQLTKIKENTNPWHRYAMLNWLINGKFNFAIENEAFRNTSEFLAHYMSEYSNAKSKNRARFIEFVTTKKFVRMGAIENVLTSQEIHDLLETPYEGEYVYYFFNGQKSYYGAYTVKDFIKIVERAADFIGFQLKILQDPKFKIWLSSLGYALGND